MPGAVDDPFQVAGLARRAGYICRPQCRRSQTAGHIPARMRPGETYRSAGPRLRANPSRPDRHKWRNRRRGWQGSRVWRASWFSAVDAAQLTTYAMPISETITLAQGMTNSARTPACHPSVLNSRSPVAPPRTRYPRASPCSGVSCWRPRPPLIPATARGLISRTEVPPLRRQ